MEFKNIWSRRSISGLKNPPLPLLRLEKILHPPFSDPKKSFAPPQKYEQFQKYHPGHSISDHQTPDLMAKNHPDFWIKLSILVNYSRQKIWGGALAEKHFFFSDLISFLECPNVENPSRFLDKIKYFG